MSLADEYKRAVRREQIRFPFATRWRIVTLRLARHTWRECWRDVLYLVRG